MSFSEVEQIRFFWHKTSCLLVLLRPKHWIKNIIIFLPLIFSKELFNASLFLKVSLGAVIISLLASAGYIINDFLDKEEDRLHPSKKNRPIARDKVTLTESVILTLLLILCALSLGDTLGVKFISCASLYILLSVGYSLWLKHIVLIDILVLASFYLIRVIAGAEILNMPYSPWLIVCTFTSALFVGIAKRYVEKKPSSNHKDELTRSTLQFYPLSYLKSLLFVTGGMVITSFIFYFISDFALQKYNNSLLILTCLPIVYGVFRFIMLIENQNDASKTDPVDIFLKDKGLLIAAVLALLLPIVVINL